jgi:hypothetical protein
MCRMMFAAMVSLVLLGARGVEAQRVAGRDLLEFPLGVLAEAPALSDLMIGGLWNPASAMLHPAARAAFGVAGLTTPQDVGVRLEMIAGSYRIKPRITGTLSVADAAVSDILRTETDPTTIGGEIPYGTTVVSAGLATAYKTATFGLATRYRWGNADRDRSGAFGVDAGAVVDRVAHTPIRIAVSTFLLSPSSTSDASYFAAADLPVFQRDSTMAVRGGFSMTRTEGRGSERYAFGTATYRLIDLSAGMSTVHEFGNSSQRWRLGLGLHHAGYTVAIGREDGGAGFGGSYQFLLTRAIK